MTFVKNIVNGCSKRNLRSARSKINHKCNEENQIESFKIMSTFHFGGYDKIITVVKKYTRSDINQRKLGRAFNFFITNNLQEDL